jgi:hypothetical protein
MLSNSNRFTAAERLGPQVMQGKLKIIYFVVDNLTPQSYHRRVLMSQSLLTSGRRDHIGSARQPILIVLGISGINTEAGC